MTKTITGIEAAWMEHDGLGAFTVAGRKVVFQGRDGRSAEWHLPTSALAQVQVRVFRAATKHQETRSS